MALQIEQLGFSYGSKPILSGLNLELESGRLHGLVGLNGAGKTTLLKLIAGHLRPKRGELFWHGSRFSGNQVAFLETQAWFYPLMSGHDYLDLFSAGNRSFAREKWNMVFNLPLDQEARSYSAGMQKKLALLGVMALDRELMLLDEPFNTLDLEAVEWLRLLLPGLAAEGRTILLTSHILETLTQTCDTISLLKEGNIEKCFEKENFQELEKMINTIHTSKVKTMLDQLLSDTRK
jgi:ABC-2 type transport system ATP-binding protein